MAWYGCASGLLCVRGARVCAVRVRALLRSICCYRSKALVVRSAAVPAVHPLLPLQKGPAVGVVEGLRNAKKQQNEG